MPCMASVRVSSVAGSSDAPRLAAVGADRVRISVIQRSTLSPGGTSRRPRTFLAAGAERNVAAKAWSEPSPAAERFPLPVSTPRPTGGWPNVKSSAAGA